MNDRFHFHLIRVLAVLDLLDKPRSAEQVRAMLKMQGMDYCLRTVQRDIEVLQQIGRIERAGKRGRWRYQARDNNE